MGIPDGGAQPRGGSPRVSNELRIEKSTSGHVFFQQC
jgi:hypothetical protein